MSHLIRCLMSTRSKLGNTKDIILLVMIRNYLRYSGRVGISKDLNNWSNT